MQFYLPEAHMSRKFPYIFIFKNNSIHFAGMFFLAVFLSFFALEYPIDKKIETFLE
jgi:hypothetical protein